MNSPFGNKELNYSAGRKVQINSVLRSDFKRQKISNSESREAKESIFEELIEKYRKYDKTSILQEKI